MASQDKDGGPAFSRPTTDDDEGEVGMSLRDYLAAKVLQGLCANPAVFAANGISGWDLVNCTEEQLAVVCHRIADVMLAERAKSEAR